MDSPTPAPTVDEQQLDAVRSILLNHERNRLRQLESENAALREQLRQHQSQTDTLAQNAQVENAALREQLRQHQSQTEALAQRVQTDTDMMVPRLVPLMPDLVGRTIRDAPEDMAEALGPVMGNAIRTQIRDARQSMVEALYPVIGETVQRAVTEAMREFQRNIDARLKTTFNLESALRAAVARLRGVSPTQLALRDALPFSLREIFIIQRESGLLVAHSHPGSAEVADSDLISGMLTAIRDFVRDSFTRTTDLGDDHSALDEVQYGSQRILLQEGQAVYAAVVFTGTEPEGFRAQLRDFIANVHVKHGSALKQFTGDPRTLPNLQPSIARLVGDLTGNQAPRSRPMSRNAKLALAGLGFFSLIVAGFICFYSQFTIALLPVAFPGPVSTQTPTTPATRTPLPTPSPTHTSTHTSTPTFVPPTVTSPPTQRPTFTPSPTSIQAFTKGNIWSRTAPDTSQPRFVLLEANTPVVVLAAYGEWVQVEWQTSNGAQQGWVTVNWIALSGPIPPERITLTPTP